MAVVNGTSFADFIHRLGDGFPGGGQNEITGVTVGADTITGGSGDDVIYGDGGGDSITGDDGHDVIFGGQGADRLFGGLGNDTFRITNLSEIDGLAETINGGSDNDTLQFPGFGAFGPVDISAATLISVESLVVTNNNVTLTSAQLGAFTGIFGTSFFEFLILTDGGTVDLTGAQIAGIDEIRGTALVNTLVLTDVADGQIVNTLGGDDVVTGGNGADQIDGGTGNDLLGGGLGNDRLVGGDGVDTLGAGDGNDTLTGGAGTDRMTGDAGNDVFLVGLVGDISGLAETVSGGSGIDTLDFQVLRASGAVDITLATISSIAALALSGNEMTLTAAQLGAFSAVFGNSQFDRLILSEAGTADLTGAEINSIDEIRGSSGADVITLTDVAIGQIIDGRAGSDTIRGTLGTDFIDGNSGADVITGAEGSDIIRGGLNTDNLAGGAGNDVFRVGGVSEMSGLAETVDGGDDVDTLDFISLGAFGRVNLAATTLSSIEILRLGGNSVTLTAAQLGAFQTITGNGNADVITLSAAGLVDLTASDIGQIDEFRGTSGADTFLFAGATGGLTISGLGGADSLVGGDDADALRGGTGNDTLRGGAGADVITGDVGTDSMSGGAGADRFDFNDASEIGLLPTRDVITDFVHGQDVIDLSDIDADTETPGEQPFSFIASAAFGGIAGQVRYTGGVLQVDTDGDRAADFQIALIGAPVVTVADLILV